MHRKLVPLTLGIALLAAPALRAADLADDVLAADRDPGRLELHQKHFPAHEGRGSALVTVKRVGGRGGAVTVDYEASAGTATVGDDFTPTTGTLAWADGDRSLKSFRIALVDDALREGVETIRLELRNPTGGAQLGRNLATGAVLILDDDRSGDGAGELAFTERAFEAHEGGGRARITVERRHGARGAIRVDYGIRPGTATAGEDYTPVAGSLEWADGDTGRKSFEVPILDDTVREGREIALLELTNPTGGAVIRPERSDAALIIEDNDGGPCAPHDDSCDDGPGQLKFDEAVFEVSESAGRAVIVVERTGGSDGAVTVRYAVEGASARAGEDFTAVTGTLSWADGDRADKTFEVPILDDTIHERAETARLRLSAPTGGARLHPVRAHAALVIRASD